MLRLRSHTLNYDTYPQEQKIHPKVTSIAFVTMRSSHFNSKHGLPPLQHFLDPDYGGLEFHSLLLQPDESFKREVQKFDDALYHLEYEAFLKDADTLQAHDVPYDNYQDLEFPRKCTPQKWSSEMSQVCNNIHELSYDRPPGSNEQSYDIERLSNGHFRHTLLFTPEDGSTPFVAKNFRFMRHWTLENMVHINREALIMDRLSGSDRISDIYGHCGFTLLVEKGYELTYQMVPRLKEGDVRGYISQEELDRLEQDDVHPMNNFTAEEKLDIAITMTESIAELHGYHEGVITHDDISIDQWMFSASDGRVMFNDFNNAFTLEWNYEKQKYCKFYAFYCGTFKAPEVYGRGSMVSEQVDIWPVGNLIFALLTGTWITI
jgi:serine/threonine protein kinase